MTQVLDGRNYLDWMVDFETQLGIKQVSSTLTAIAVARNMLLGHLLSVAERDIDGSSNGMSHRTIVYAKVDLCCQLKRSSVETLNSLRQLSYSWVGTERTGLSKALVPPYAVCAWRTSVSRRIPPEEGRRGMLRSFCNGVPRFGKKYIMRDTIVHREYHLLRQSHGYPDWL